MTNILLLNGPNLNLLGTRETDVYGTDTLSEILDHLTAFASELDITLQTFQSNIEGELINRLHEARSEGVDFVLINPGAFTHTSIALRDAFLGVEIPFIELHLSNVHAREEFRQHSYLADIAVGTIAGFGAHSYDLALTAAIEYLKT